MAPDVRVKVPRTGTDNSPKYTVGVKVFPIDLPGLRGVGVRPSHEVTIIPYVAIDELRSGGNTTSVPATVDEFLGSHALEASVRASESLLRELFGEKASAVPLLQYSLENGAPYVVLDLITPGIRPSLEERERFLDRFVREVVPDDATSHLTLMWNPTRASQGA